MSSGRSTEQDHRRGSDRGRGESSLATPDWIAQQQGKSRASKWTPRAGQILADVIPGKYEFVAGLRTSRYSVVRILSEDGTISGQALTVHPGGSHRALAVGWEVRSTVEGFAQRNGKRRFRRDDRFWCPKITSESRSLRRDQSGSRRKVKHAT